MSTDRPFSPLVALAAALLVAGCAGEAPVGGSDCPACADGTVCEPERGECVPALAEGERCGALAGAEGRCAEGLVCGKVGGGAERCSKDCTRQNEAEVCGSGRSCFARPEASGESTGFCGTAAGEGEACDHSGLSYCSGGDGQLLTCISPTEGQTAGRCFELCDPAEPDCRAGRACADPFPADPGRGICVTPPGPYPGRCDHSELVFCGHREICVRPTAASWGYCHRRCDGPADCPGEACVEPAPGVRFCAPPVPRCLPGADQSSCPTCDGTEDRFCGPGDLCVQLVDGPTVCKQDCTLDKTACEAGTCAPLGESGLRACL